MELWHWLEVTLTSKLYKWTQRIKNGYKQDFVKSDNSLRVIVLCRPR